MEDRSRYIVLAKTAGFRVVGYYFQSRFQDAVVRNADRLPAEQIPVKGIGGTYKRLQLPSLQEGFDALFYVALLQDGFDVQEWSADEV
jgi:hypothetical protein